MPSVGSSLHLLLHRMPTALLTSNPRIMVNYAHYYNNVILQLNLCILRQFQLFLGTEKLGHISNSYKSYFLITLPGIKKCPTVPDPDLEISGGGGGGAVSKKVFGRSENKVGGTWAP